MSKEEDEEFAQEFFWKEHDWTEYGVYEQFIAFCAEYELDISLAN